ncbi:hypothetical protein GOP80_02815 [Planococcaceae bacterium Storch 2/2-2]|nr:hypothetical protein [Planococcaceae bacterium Storch 2/2-2]
MEIIAVTDETQTIEELVETIVAIEPFVDRLIIRERFRKAHELSDLYDRLIENEVPRHKLVVHERVDLAMLYDIRSVQLPYDSLSLKRAKAAFPTIHFGRSVHSVDEAKHAIEDGADALLFGHVFDTTSKSGLPPKGIQPLRQIAEQSSVPVYAIGGIDHDTVTQLLDLPIQGVAVRSGFFQADQPAKWAERFARIVKERCE